MHALAWMVAAPPAQGSRSAAETEVLDLERRRAAFDAVREHPGAHLRDLARTLGIDPRHAQYHLDRLQQAGLVTIVQDGGFTRHYPRTFEGLARDAHSAAEKRALTALRKPLSLRAILVLLAQGPLALQALAAALAVAPSTISYHLTRMADDGVVQRLGAGQSDRLYAVAEPALIEQLLIRHPPKRSLIGDFVDVWDALALPPRTRKEKD